MLTWWVKFTHSPKSPPKPVMFHIYIDTRKNCVSVRPEEGSAAEKTHPFPRRWEALLFALLVQESKDSRSLKMASLNAVLAQRGQPKALNRAQILRLLQSLQTFFDGHIPMGLRVETPPRKTTVGPWLLRHEADVRFFVDGEPEREHWPHPAITSDPMDDEHLYDVLSVLLVADALACEGRFKIAIDVLGALDHHRLSDEASGLVALRLCSWHKHVGNFAQAREQALTVIQRSPVADPGLHACAQLMMQRIDYDENPAGNWEHLWRTTDEPPGQHAPHADHGSDWRTLAEWHNMRALLARRRLHALLDTKGSSARVEPEYPPQPPPEHSISPCTATSLHALALRHFQAAMYMAAWFRDWDRLQAYVANLAYHLQSLLRLGAPLAIQAPAVLRWHRLTMAYEDKFSAGRDSAWEYIFFGKFWLENHAELSPSMAIDPLAHSLGDTSPQHEAFYKRALERLQECGDDRQVAIGRSLYLQFAQQHMKGRAQQEVLRQQSEILYRLITAQPALNLLSSLTADGYDRCWPENLRRLLQGQVGERNK